MEIVILLVPLAFLLVALGIGAFVWALRRGQFDDLDSPQLRILFDDQQSRQHPPAEKADPGAPEPQDDAGEPDHDVR